MKYDIKTLVYIPQLQELTNDLYLANSIPSSIVSIDGEILTGSGWQRICMDFHRRHPVTNRECIKSGTILRKNTDENTPFTIYECPHGLVDASAPIFIDGEHVANILSGQVFLTPPTPAQKDAFRQRARRLGFDEKKYMAAFREVPIVEEAKFKSNLSFLKKLAGFIAESGFTQSRFLEEVREHKKAERTYRDLVENLNDAIYQVDEKGMVNYLSPQIKAICGHSNSELLGADFLQLVHPDELDKLRRDFDDALQGRQAPGEYRIKNSNGEYRWVRNSSRPILEGEKAIGIQGILSDITDRKRVTNELIKSEQALRTIFNNTHDAIFIHDLDGRILDVNQKTLEMYQVTREQVIGMYIAEDFSSPENPMDRLHGYWESALAGNTLTFEWFTKRPNDDSVFEVDVALKKITLDEREVILANVRDITLRKAHERILKESEEKFRALVENSKDAIMRFDRKHRHLYVNPMAEEQNGIPLPEWIGKTHQELGFPKSLCNIWESAIEEVFQTGRVHRKEFQLPNGQWIDWILMPEKDAEGKVKAIITSARDITERILAEKKLRENEERLARSKKMESLGLLAGGVAHDLNNVLAGIIGFPEVIMLSLPRDSELRRPLQLIHESGTKAADIVEDLLTMARNVASHHEPLCLNDHIAKYLNSLEFGSLQKRYPEVDVSTELGDDLFHINGSPVHINKVVMNLVSNAVEAVENSGKVVIATKNIYLDRMINGYDSVKSGEYVVLTVSDDGPGIPPRHLKRIFEPFFSKKKMGRSGTGLGLAVVWNTIQDHKGYIDVQSGSGGTEFALYFPITRQKRKDYQTEASLEHLKGAGEKILIIDDVENQREIMTRMLHELDYVTASVSSGESAIDYLKKNKADLVLLDMIMEPGMDGREAYKEIIAVHPGQKAIITSGYAESVEVRKTLALGAARHLKKPLTMLKLGKAVKEILKQ